ncbi:MAG: FAD-binding oxidoreductase [Caldimonas sp.]
MSLDSKLRSLLGPDAVLTGEADVAPYATDWRGRYRGNAACVVLPRSTEEVAAVVRACADVGVPIVPQGGNTSLCEGAIPRSGEPASVVISLQRMRRVRSIDVSNNSIEVDAGCVLAQVQQAAAEHGRLYPVSLGAEGSCQIGGNIATNAGGTGVLRYGNTRDNVLGIEAVLPDGRVWDGLYRLRKNNTGFDLKHLFIGSEGTLGVITAATLKLHPLPTARAVAWMALESPQAALTMLGRFQQRCGGVLSAYEMMNDVQLGIVVDHVAGRRAPLPVAHPWHVLVELADTGEEGALTALLQDVIERGADAGEVANAAIASSGQQRADFWEVRHSVSEGNKKAGMGINTDCAVPVSAVPEFIEHATLATHAILPGVPIIVVAHVGDGNVHFIPLASFDQWRAFDDADAVSHRVKHAVNEVAHALRGTFSAEHGIGQQLTQEMSLFKPPVEIDLMRGIKQLIDPHDLFNPGRLLPPTPTPP